MGSKIFHNATFKFSKDTFFVIGPFDGPKIGFNLRQFLQFGSVFRSGLLEGPKLPLIVNGNLKMFENNYENCFYLDLDL